MSPTPSRQPLVETSENGGGSNHFESILGHFGVAQPESLLSLFWVTLIVSGPLPVELGARRLRNDNVCFPASVMLVILDGQIGNRQWLTFSERSQLWQAIPQFHVERILHQRTPIARFESQCNERRVYEDQILCF